MYLSGNINEIFWVSMFLLFILSYMNLIVFKRIQKYTEEIGKI